MSGKSKDTLFFKAGPIFHSLFSQCLLSDVTSLILISGLKLVANGCPWSPSLQSKISKNSILSK